MQLRWLLVIPALAACGGDVGGPHEMLAPADAASACSAYNGNAPIASIDGAVACNGGDAAGRTGTAPGQATGAAGEPCNPDGSCRAGLTCLERVDTTNPTQPVHASLCEP